MKRTVMPLIKWTGSKRKQASKIVDLFPAYIDTYYEPFVGGGSVMHELIHRIIDGKIKVNKIVCSDINSELIGLWNAFKNDREKLFNYYKDHNETLIEYGDVENTPEPRDQIKKAQVYYYDERKRFNQMDNSNPEKPYLFFWITRHSFNGLIRYNPRGEFNAPYHVGGYFGITAEKLQPVFDEWGKCIDNVNIEFINDTYENVINKSKENDLIYMDPPYVEVSGIYIDHVFNKENLYKELDKLNSKKVKWLLSYDGKSGEHNWTQDVPENLYKEHMYISSGQSNFRKMKKIDVTEVKESLYVNY